MGRALHQRVVVQMTIKLFRIQILFVGVRSHHAFKGALQAGLQSLSLAHHALHGRKLSFVPGQQLGHASLQLVQFRFVFRNLGGQVGALSSQGAAGIQ